MYTQLNIYHLNLRGIIEYVITLSGPFPIPTGSLEKG